MLPSGTCNTNIMISCYTKVANTVKHGISMVALWACQHCELASKQTSAFSSKQKKCYSQITEHTLYVSSKIEVVAVFSITFFFSSEYFLPSAKLAVFTVTLFYRS